MQFETVYFKCPLITAVLFYLLAAMKSRRMSFNENGNLTEMSNKENGRARAPDPLYVPFDT